MTVREYRPADCEESAALFYNTVHTINAWDYTEAQLNAWAPDNMDLEAWNRSLLAHYSLVAVENGVIIGFGDLAEAWYLDRLYVHKDCQGRGVGSALCVRLEQAAQGRIVTHASITARLFFEKRGYRVVREQQVTRRGITLTNFAMEKRGERST